MLEQREIAEVCRSAIAGAGLNWSNKIERQRVETLLNDFSRLNSGSTHSVGYLVGRFLGICVRFGLLTPPAASTHNFAKVVAVAAGVALGLVGWWTIGRADRQATAENARAVDDVRSVYAELAKPGAPSPDGLARAPSTVASEPTCFDYPDQLAEVTSLRLQVAQLQAQVSGAQDETRRHREELERAVTELNRIRSVDGARQLPECGASPAPTPRARLSQYTPPQVVVSDGGIQVSGRLWNSSEVDALGTILIELLLDSRPSDSTQQHLLVPANSEMTYAHTFFRGGTNGTYSARVTPSY